MSGLITYDDSSRREDLAKGKLKAFNKKAYWEAKRSQKNRKKRRRK